MIVLDRRCELSKVRLCRKRAAQDEFKRPRPFWSITLQFGVARVVSGDVSHVFAAIRSSNSGFDFSRLQVCIWGQAKRTGHVSFPAPCRLPRQGDGIFWAPALSTMLLSGRVPVHVSANPMSDICRRPDHSRRWRPQSPTPAARNVRLPAIRPGLRLARTTT